MIEQKLSYHRAQCRAPDVVFRSPERPFMLDVHPPHTPTHTWRDFFIHIATITVGLLIAVSLEQTVEFFHHRHQRHLLEERLRTEAESNIVIVERNIAKMRADMAYIDTMLAALNNAPVAGGSVELDLSHFAKPEVALKYTSLQPAQTAWTLAKTTGGIGLLPEDEAQVYARLDYEAELISADLDYPRAQDGVDELFRARKGLSPDRARVLTLTERDALLRAFSVADTQYLYMINLQLDERGACRGVLHGARSVENMYRFMLDEFEPAKN